MATRVVAALDSFKGSMTAAEAVQVVCTELQRIGTFDTVGVPMADGGEGTADALVAARAGDWLTVEGVTGPLPEMVLDARIGWLADEGIAVVEMARASGLMLLPTDERQPMRTTTFGTGQTLRAAMKRGAQTILLTLGGSATVDGGTGAARAVGWRFLDADGRETGGNGESLHRIARIVAPDELPRVKVRALCDVENPLCGPHGAARVYGPQKGATREMVLGLEEGLANLARCIERDLGLVVEDMPGAGAAGGFGAGARAFLNADLVPGFDAVAETCSLSNALADTDWVITGEGRLDAQSLQGKVVSGVTRLARRAGVRVAVLAGAVSLSEADWRAAGIEKVLACTPSSMDETDAMRRAPDLLAKATRRLAAHLSED